MSASGTFLDRMRANAAMALSEGATLKHIEAHLLAVARGHSRPSVEDYLDAEQVAELIETLNGFRSHQPGEVVTDSGDDSTS